MQYADLYLITCSIYAAYPMRLQLLTNGAFRAQAMTSWLTMLTLELLQPFAMVLLSSGLQ